jgi:cell division protein FtsW (lipid II flippase)
LQREIAFVSTLSERTAPGYWHQYIRKEEEDKHMGLKQDVEHFKQLPPVTQVALVVFALVVVVLLVVYPAAGTSLITFLVALKMLLTRQ